MAGSLTSTLVALGLLSVGCGGLGADASRAESDSAAAAPPPVQRTSRSPASMAPAARPAPPPRESRPPAVVSESHGDAMDQGDALRRECLAYRASGSRGGKGEARFAPERDDARFRPRSAALTRHVACGFRAGKLARATEQFHLRLASQDRENPGFSTGNPNNSSRYYLVCEGSVRTSLAAFTAGQRLSFADNTFTLPCGHMIYPKGTSDPATASRVSGVYTYKVRSATLEVRRGPRLDHPSFTLLVDVVVVNPLETLELRGRVSGEISTAVAVVECGTGPRFTKQIPHPACG